MTRADRGGTDKNHDDNQKTINNSGKTGTKSTGDEHAPSFFHFSPHGVHLPYSRFVPRLEDDGRAPGVHDCVLHEGAVWMT
ncbi:MAG: hypothetical protein AAF399_28690, partial [Bacteroidota bacterium]